MNTDTMTHTEAAEAFLSTRPGIRFGIDFLTNGSFGACCYWPTGDILRDTLCFGRGATLAEAIADMEQKVEEAKVKRKTLKTAAECKDAVIALIREHDAAPASFRDAVDALPVAK